MFLILRRVLVVMVLLNICAGWYIDPGATSLIWQVVVSGVVGIGFTLRRTITGLVRRFRRRGLDDK
jgi:hypothetical protein